MKCTWCQLPLDNPETLLHPDCESFPDYKFRTAVRAPRSDYIAEIRPPFIIRKQKPKPFVRDNYFESAYFKRKADIAWHQAAKESERRILARFS